MLLTIHNLPSSYRYTDIKGLLHQKCGLTEVILDNLVNEGKGKKVTVGLASDDDGALVTRKINGLFLDGHQLYIEDRRRKTAELDQPYRSAAQHIDRSPQPQQSSMTSSPGMPMATMPVMWNYNMVAAPYMGQMPIDQNFAYSGYDGAPQAAPYTPPQAAPVESERGYPGFQGAAYPPVNESSDQNSGPWNRSEREQGSDRFRRQDRKRRHSPERLAPPKKRESKWGDNQSPVRREASPPRQQWPQQNQGPRPPFREPEQFPRNQNQFQPREPKPRPEPVPQNQSRFQPRDPKPQTEQFSRNQNEFQPRESKPRPELNPRNQDQFQPRAPKPRPEPIPRNQNQFQPREPKPRPELNPRNQNQFQPRAPKPRPEPVPRNQNQFQPREPSPNYRRTDPQWENNRWDEPNSSPRAQREPEWGNDNQRNWEPVTDKVWDSQPNQRWRDEPRPNMETSPQWETREWDSRVPEEERRPDWFDQSPNNQRDQFPGNQEFYDPSPVKRDSRPLQREPAWDDRRQRNERRSPRKLSREAPRERSKPRRDRREDRPRSQDRPSGPRDKPDYWKQVANDYPDPKRPEFNRGGPHNAPRPDKAPKFKQDTQRPAMKEAPYPDDRFIKKPLTLTAMVNKDFSNRGQATAEIAKAILGIKSKQALESPLKAFTFKQMKLCIKSRIDVMLGEELALDTDDIMRRYRMKFPVNGDKALVQQIGEKSRREFEAMDEQRALNKKKEQSPANKDPKTETGAPSGTATGNDNAKVQPEVKNNGAKVEAVKKPEQVNVGASTTGATPKTNEGPPVIKTKKGQPLTDKQVIRQMKMQNQWEYSQDDPYKLDEITDKVLEEELAKLDKIFEEECSKPDDPQEELLCKRILTDSLTSFNKTVRLNIAKRFLNIPTGLSMRVFSVGKPPKKTALKEYLKKYRVERLTVKKSVKGGMFILNLSRFQDFDELCRKETAVIDGIPVTFKPLHLTGPPPKVSRQKGKELRQQRIMGQIEDINDFVETDDYTQDVEIGNPVHDANDNTEDIDDNEANDNEVDGNEGDDKEVDDNIGDGNEGDIKDGDDWNAGDDWGNNAEGDDWGENADTTGVSIDNVDEEDLEDF